MSQRDSQTKTSLALRVVGCAAAAAAVAYAGYLVRKTFFASAGDGQQNNPSSSLRKFAGLVMGSSTSTKAGGNNNNSNSSNFGGGKPSAVTETKHLYGFDVPGVLTPLQAPLGTQLQQRKQRHQIHVQVRTHDDKVASVVRCQLAYSLQSLDIKPQSVFLEIVVEPPGCGKTKMQQQQQQAMSLSSSDSQLQQTHLSTTDDLFDRDLTRWYVHGFLICSARALENRLHAVPEVVLREIKFRVERLQAGSKQDRVVATTSLVQAPSLTLTPSPPTSALCSFQKQQTPTQQQQQQHQPHQLLQVNSGGSFNIRRNSSLELGSSSRTVEHSGGFNNNNSNNTNNNSSSTHCVTSMNNSIAEHPGFDPNAHRQQQQHRPTTINNRRNISFGEHHDDDDEDIVEDDDDDTATTATAAQQMRDGNSSGKEFGSGKLSRSGGVLGANCSLATTVNFDIHRSNTPKIPQSRSLTTADTSAQISASATPILSFTATPQHFKQQHHHHHAYCNSSSSGGTGGGTSRHGSFASISPKTVPTAGANNWTPQMPIFPTTTSTEAMALFGGHITPHVTPGSQYFLPPQQLPPLSAHAAPTASSRRKQIIAHDGSGGFASNASAAAAAPRAPSSSTSSSSTTNNSSNRCDATATRNNNNNCGSSNSSSNLRSRSKDPRVAASSNDTSSGKSTPLFPSTPPLSVPPTNKPPLVAAAGVTTSLGGNGSGAGAVAASGASNTTTRRSSEEDVTHAPTPSDGGTGGGTTPAIGPALAPMQTRINLLSRSDSDLQQHFQYQQQQQQRQLVSKNAATRTPSSVPEAQFVLPPQLNVDSFSDFAVIPGINNAPLAANSSNIHDNSVGLAQCDSVTPMAANFLVTSVPSTPSIHAITATFNHQHPPRLPPATSASRRIVKLLAQRESTLITVAFRALTEVKNSTAASVAGVSNASSAAALGSFPSEPINNNHNNNNNDTNNRRQRGEDNEEDEDDDLDITGDAALKSIPSDIVLFDATRNICDNPLGIDARSRDGRDIVVPSVLITGLLFLLDAQHSINDGIISSLSVCQVVAQKIAGEHNENWEFIEREIRKLNSDPLSSLEQHDASVGNVRVRNLAELQFALEAHVDVFAGLAVSDPDELYTLVDHDDDRVLLPLMGCSFGAFCLVSAVFHKLVGAFGPLNDENFRAALRACNPSIRDSVCSRLFRGFNRRRATTLSLFDFVHYVSRQVARSTGHVTKAITARALAERLTEERLNSMNNSNNANNNNIASSGSTRTATPGLSDTPIELASVPSAAMTGGISSQVLSMVNSFAFGASVTSVSGAVGGGAATAGSLTPAARSRANSMGVMRHANESTTTLPYNRERSEQPVQTQQQQQQQPAPMKPPLFDPLQQDPLLQQQQQQQQGFTERYNASFGVPGASVPLDVLLNALQRCGDRTVVEALAKVGLLRALFVKHEAEWPNRSFWFDSLVDEDHYL